MLARSIINPREALKATKLFHLLNQKLQKDVFSIVSPLGIAKKILAKYAFEKTLICNIDSCNRLLFSFFINIIYN